MLMRWSLLLALTLSVSACGNRKDNFPTTLPGGSNVQGNGSLNGSGNALSTEWNILKGNYSGSVLSSQGSQTFSMQVADTIIGGATYGTASLQTSGTLLSGLPQPMVLGFISRTISGPLAYYNFISEVLIGQSWAGGKNVAFQMGLAVSYNGQNPQAAHSQSWMELLECQQSAQGWVCDRLYTPNLDFNLF